MSLTRKRFREWLDTMPPHEIAGFRKQETCCPLARFLKWDGAGESYVWVGVGSFRVGAHFVMALPNWAYVLRRAVDTDERYFDRATVTAGEVRGLLAEIEAEGASRLLIGEMDP